MADPSQTAWLAPQLLAYIGDGVFELHIRQLLLPAHVNIESLHRATVARVRAERQAELLKLIQPHLTAEEAEVVRRGRNAKTTSRRKDLYAYRYATAFECLIGYLHLSDQQARLDELWALLDEHVRHATAAADPAGPVQTID